MPYALRAACLALYSISGFLAAGLPALAQDLMTPPKAAAASDKALAEGKNARKIARRHGQKPKKGAALLTRPAAGGATKRYSRANADEVNTWLIFGFTEGSDVGEKGERTLFFESLVRMTPRESGFAAWDGAAGIGYSLTNRAVVSLAFTPAFERNAEQILTPAGTTLLNSRGAGTVASLKYQVLRRDESPFGLAVQVSPFWQHVDSGPIRHDTMGSEFRVLADRVLVPNQWFAALNLAYQPYRESYSDGSTFPVTAFELSAAVSRQVSGNLFLGAEIRHTSKHEGLFFNRWAGHALYAGPTAFLLLGEQGYLGLAWSARLAQEVNAGTAQIPDFDGFDRHQLRLKAGISF
jgi:hypothetical protein